MLLLALPLMFAVTPVQATHAPQGFSLNEYSRYFYDRYSRHFDSVGLRYAAPAYGISDFSAPQTAREWISLASYYKYRAFSGNQQARLLIRQAITEALKEIESRPLYTLSFHDAEAFFLMVRMDEHIPTLLTVSEKTRLRGLLKRALEPGIQAPDSENRAVVAAVHWRYLARHLVDGGDLSSAELRKLDQLIQKKIDRALAHSLTKTGWYFENNKKDFTPHYHAVSAFMLAVYGDMTSRPEYSNLARTMYFNLKKISFDNGMVEARIGHRPLGLGAQFYLMQGLLGYYFDDNDYRVYLFYASGNRFFSDPLHPDRLEYHSTIEYSDPNFHDDYAFSDAAELALTVPKFSDAILQYKHYFDAPLRTSFDGTFRIINNKKRIQFNRTQVILGSFGNWSRVF